MDYLRVSMVYIPDVSCLSPNDFYVGRISRNTFPNISSGNSLLLLQIWFRERKGSWHTDVFNSCAYRRICCVLHVCNVAGNELAQLDHTKKQMIMGEKHTLNKWIGYAILWSLIAYPCLILACNSPENFVFTLLVFIAIFLYLSYKFGKEKGIIAGILMFFITIILNLFVAFSTYAILLGLTWRN